MCLVIIPPVHTRGEPEMGLPGAPSNPPFRRFVGLLLLLGCASAVAGVGEDTLLRLPVYSREGKRRKVFSVDDFGAVGDGLVDDTKAFRDAWDVVCSSSSKAVLEFSAGKKYLIWPADMAGPCQSKVTVIISGIIVAPVDPSIWDQFDPQKWLYFHGINRMTVKGGGVINGMGDQWWAQSCKRNSSNPCHSAPTALKFHKCKNLRVHDLNILNSQQTHIAFSGCSGVKASNLKVEAPTDSPNTDGIHISASTSVVVRDSRIGTGDDCISIVSNSSRVRLKGIVCGPGHGISIGSLGKSNSWVQVHNILVDGAVVTNTTNGVRIKTWQGGRGFVHGVTFQNIVMRNVENPIIVDQYYCDHAKCANQTDAVKVSGISYLNIRGTSATDVAVKFSCTDSYACRDIFLEDIQLSLESGKEASALCWNAMGFGYGTVVPPSCLSDYSLLSTRQKVETSPGVSSL